MKTDQIEVTENVIEIKTRNLLFTVIALIGTLAVADTDPIDDSGSGDRHIQYFIYYVVLLRWKEADNRTNQRRNAYDGFRWLCYDCCEWVCCGAAGNGTYPYASGRHKPL